MTTVDPAERIVKQLMTTVKCTVCGNNYESDNVNILGHQEELWFLAVACSRCRTRGLVAALIRGVGQVERVDPSAVSFGESQAGRVETESAGVPTLAKVTTEDVRHMHEFLNQFDGDFTRLFGGEGQRP
ncbi:MAG: hypothetical protein HY319_31010 [Armatimonadetes bacterium]|nr:hypothetical protein [Armatimonadota bacterium]